jgi:hypothetical protein
MASFFTDDKVLIFGGFDTRKNLEDTWIYDLSYDQWKSVTVQHIPPARYGQMMATPNGTDNPVMFGGWGNGEKSDTWIFLPSNYSQSGYYTSPPHDTGGNSSFPVLDWKASVPDGTGLKFQFRSADSHSKLINKTFVGPGGTEKTYYTESGVELLNHYGDRWIQYKAYLNTSNTSVTPILKKVSISFNRFPSAPTPIQPTNGNWINQSYPIFQWSFNDSDSQKQYAFDWQMGRFPSPNEIEYSSGIVISHETSYKMQLPLGEGHWYWCVRTEDSEGDWGPYCEYSNLSVDLKPPRDFTPVALPSSWTAGPCDISFFTVDNLSGIDHYEILIDGKSMGSQESPYHLPGNLSDGIHLILVRAYDKAGNRAEGKTKIYLDRTPPQPFTPIAAPSGWSRIDHIIQFAANDSVSGIDYYEIKTDDGLFSRANSPLTLQGLTDGQHEIAVRAFDRAGNLRDENLTLFIDKTEPIDFFVTATPSGWTNLTPSIDFCCTDIVSQINYFSMMIDDTPFIRVASPFVPEGLTEGVHTVTVRAYDLAGNFAEGEVRLLIDRTSPENFTPIANPDNWTKSDPVISFSTSDEMSGIHGFELQVDNGEFSKAESPYTLLGLADGKHVITVRAFDNAGNSVDGNVTVFIDRTPPGPIKLMIDNGRVATNRRTVNLRIAASDNDSGPEMMCFSNHGMTFTAWEPFISNRNWTLSDGKGNKTVYIKVRDHAGNEAPIASATITFQSKPMQNLSSTFTLLASTLIVIIIIGLLIWKRQYAKKGFLKPPNG